MASMNSNLIDARGATFSDVGRYQFNITQLAPDLNHSRTSLCCLKLFKTQCLWSATLDLNQLLLPVEDAAFSRSGPVPKCHDGTRKELIANIQQWAQGTGSPVCWLNGPAGSGKSAVSQTIAEWCVHKNRLAASFFFLRGGGDRSSIAHFIPTLAYQLSMSFPATKPHIQLAIQSEPSISRRSLKHQFKKLLIDPIQLTARNRNLTAIVRQKPIVIIIDALDECDDKELMAEFIEVVTDAYRHHPPPPFHVFFTSRAEEHLRKKLVTPGAHTVIYPLALSDFDAHDDIRTFLLSRFRAIYVGNRQAMRNVPVRLPWPSSADLEALVDKASGSFLFASTLIKFIDDGSDLPHRKLSMALKAHAGLDPLYSQVLLDAPRGHDVKHFLGTIVLLKDFLSITSLGVLLQREPADILRALLGIQSIIMIPSDDDHPVQPFHASLRDFLTTETRSRNLFIDPPTYHIILTVGCLNVMAVPPEDEVYRGEVQQYACNHWCYHFHQSLTTGGHNLLNHPSYFVLMNYLTAFVSQLFESWFNTLIWCGQLPNVLEVLQLVVSLLEVSVSYLLSSWGAPDNFRPSIHQLSHKGSYGSLKISKSTRRYDLVTYY
jgi:hypothetical protein